MSLHLDAIEANALEGGTLSSISAEKLSLIRVLTTPRRLRDDFGVDAPKEGEWLQIEIAQRPGHPRVWLFNTDDPAVSSSLVNAVTIERLNPDGAQIGALKQLCSVAGDETTAEQFLERLNLRADKNLSIAALDVGQASCVAFMEGEKCIGYFDVGRPLFLNGKSFPNPFQHSWSKRGFVLLSHWDYDHFALGLNNAALMSLWYGPKQEVGPVAAKFQRALGSRLSFLSGSAGREGVFLHHCDGSDRNSSGYIMRVDRRGEAVLLTGDADYTHVPSELKKHLTSVMIPHHSGPGTAPPPPRRGLSAAVASYGTPNTYKHPSPTQLSAHKKLEWDVLHTATHEEDLRGPRLLYPLRRK